METSADLSRCHALHWVRTAAADRDLLGAHSTEENQITRTGNFVTTEKLPTWSAPCGKLFIFKVRHSTAKPGIAVAKGKHRAQ
jgi:hypothetical protein